MPVSAVELATAYISIVPSIKGIEGHLTSALSGTEGEAKTAGEKAGDGFGGGFTSKMKNMAETIGIYEVGAKIKEFASDSIKYFEDVQRINAQTATVITSTGGAAGVTAGHITELSDSLEAKTATEARSIQSGANMMLTFTGVKNAAGAGNDVFDQSVSVITDLSRVMGQDTKQSAIQLGKALNDPVTGMTALKRVGVSFSEDQKTQIKQFVAANDIMGAQKIILAEMNKEFGGSGESYAKTMAGQQDLFKEATDKLGGSLVGLLAPALTGATTGLTEMLTKATEWVQSSGAIQTGFTTLKNGAQPLISALKNIWGGFKDIAEKAWPYIKTFADSVGQGFKSVYNFIVPVVKGVGDFITNLGKGSTVSTFGGILTTLGHAFEGVMKFVAPLGAAIGVTVGFLGKLPGPIWAGAAALGVFLLLRGPMTAMMTGIDGMGQSMFRVFSGGMISGIKSMGTSLLSALGGPVGIAIAAVTVALTFLIPKLFQASTAEVGAKDATDNYTGAVKGLSQALTESGGVIDENIRKTALAELQTAKWGKSSTDLTSYADRLGLTYGDLVDGMLGVPGAAEKISNAYDSQVISLQKTIDAGTSYNSQGAEIQTADAAAAEDKLRYMKEQHDAYAKMPGVIADATTEYRKEQDAIKGTAAATAAATAIAKGGFKQQEDDYVSMLANRASAALAEQDNAQGSYLRYLNTRAVAGAAAQKKEADDQKAGAVAAVAATKAAYDAGYVHASEVYDNFQSHIAGLTMTVSADGIKTFQTDSEIAFAKFNTDAQAAATQASLFWFAMEDPTKVTTQQVIYADAAAIRAVGAAYRDAAAATADIATKQAALDKLKTSPLTGQVSPASIAAAQRTLADSQDAVTSAQANLAKAQHDPLAKGETPAQRAITTAAAQRSVAAAIAAVTSNQQALSDLQHTTGETQAQRDAQIAAAQRDLDAAKATAAGNDANIYAAQQTAGQTSAKMISDIARHTTTYGEALQKVTDYLTTERASFISSEESAGASATAANAAADAIGLIPSNAKTIITADNYQALKAADEASDAGTKLAKKKVEAQFTANAAMHKKTLDEANARNLANKRATLNGDPLPFNGVVATVNGVQLPGKTVKIGADANGLSAEIQAAIDLVNIAIATWVPPIGDIGPVGAGSSVYGATDYKFPAPGKAGGGDIVGAGTGTSDSVPIWASTGEFVSTAATNARHHAQLMRWNAEGAYAGGGDIRYRAATTTSGPLIGTVIQQPGQSPWQLAADLDRRMAFMGAR